MNVKKNKGLPIAAKKEGFSIVNQVLIKRIITIAALIALVVVVVIYFSAFWPILLALLTAICVEPLVIWLKKKLRLEKRIIPVTIVFTSVIVLFALISYITFTKVAKTLYEWTINLPKYVTQIQGAVNKMIVRFNEFIAEVPQGYLIISEMEKQSRNLADWALQLTTKLINAFGSWLQGVPNFLFLLIFYFLTYFLLSLDFPRLTNIFYSFFKEETAEKLRYVFQEMGRVFFGWWKAQFILSIGVFAITYASLLFIAPNAAFIMSVVIWFVDIIPLYVGPAIVLMPWGIIAIMLGDVNMGIQLNVLAIVLLILRRIIEPKVLGDSIGLGALPTVLSMYFGYVFMGFIGLIIGPFVYMAIQAVIESGLFNFKSFKESKKL